MTRSPHIAAALLAAAVLAPGAAVADEPPAAPAAPPAPRAGFTLPRGALGIAVNLEVEMSADRVGEPVSVSPDLAYGVTDDLTVAVVHSKYAITGLRAAAGGGLCLTGDDGGCLAVYDNVGAEAWYRVGAGATSLAVGGGVHALSIDRGFVSAKLGVKVRHPLTDRLALVALPSVIVAITEREADPVTGARNRDTLWVPVLAPYKATDALTVAIGSGLKGPLDGFADAWQVPLAFVGQYAIDPQLTVGASWVFGQIIGGAENPPAPAPAVVGPDLRGVQLWVAYTMP